MKVKGLLQDRKKDPGKGSTSPRELLLFFLCTVFTLLLLFFPRFQEKVHSPAVYAATAPSSGDRLPPGIQGVVLGVENSLPGKRINRIGISCERLIVGQRASLTGDNMLHLDMEPYLLNAVERMNLCVNRLSSHPGMMSDEDYENLLHIVEAESGGEDLKGRILVANVVLNRVKDEEFPDTVTDVIWEKHNGISQFSPTWDGRIDDVVVSAKTIQAVNMALSGVDYSQGALFFVEKPAAEKESLVWFEKDLKKLFKHGAHDFYTYPDAATGSS